MKITIYELLGMIKDGKAPKEIKYNGTIYKYDNYKGDVGYVDKTQDPYKWFEKEIDCDVKQYLDDEVEILEKEKKIPEKLNITYEKNCKNNYKWKCEGYNISTPQKLIADKINSIIDYLKSKGE